MSCLKKFGAGARVGRGLKKENVDRETEASSDSLKRNLLGFFSELISLSE